MRIHTEKNYDQIFEGVSPHSQSVEVDEKKKQNNEKWIAWVLRKNDAHGVYSIHQKKKINKKKIVVNFWTSNFILFWKQKV